MCPTHRAPHGTFVARDPRCPPVCSPTPQPSTPTAGSRSAAARSATSPPSSARRCSSTTRSTSAPAAARRWRRSARTACGVRDARRSSAGRWRAWRTTRACGSTSPPVASSTSRWPPVCRPRACVFHGNNKSVAELRQAIDGGRRPHRRRLLRRARPPRCARGRGRRPHARRPAAHHARRPRPHPRVHRHRPGRLEVRLQPRQRRRDASGRAGAARRRACDLVGLHCHIGSNVFAAVELRQGRRGHGHVRRAARPPRARARWRARRRLRRDRGGADDHAVGQRAARRLRRARRAVTGERRARSIDRRRGRDHRVHASARSSTSPACAPTSRSTAA